MSLTHLASLTCSNLGTYMYCSGANAAKNSFSLTAGVILAYLQCLPKTEGTVQLILSYTVTYALERYDTIRINILTCAKMLTACTEAKTEKPRMLAFLTCQFPT